MDLDLQRFLEIWKNELQKSSAKPKDLEKGGFSSNKRCRRIEEEDQDCQSPSEKQRCPEGLNVPSTRASSSLTSVISSSLHDSSARKEMSRTEEGELSATTVSSQPLVDQLISDLNEITSIPFFDIQLPKEIAVMIFSFLNAKDLCNCCMEQLRKYHLLELSIDSPDHVKRTMAHMAKWLHTCAKIVSKSWSVLAQDNTVWMLKCQQMGYDTVSSIHAVQNWKNIVKELVLREQKIQQNWKEKVCTVTDFQPRHTGTLCCTAYDNGQIVSSYSCGSTYAWFLGREAMESPVKVTNCPTTLPNVIPVKAAVNGDIAAIGDNGGSMYIMNMNTCQAIHTFNDLASIQSVDVRSDHNHYSVAIASGGVLSTQSNISILSSSDLCQWCTVKLDYPLMLNVNRISLIHTDNRDTPQILYSTDNSLSIQSVGEGYDRAIHLVDPPANGGTVTSIVNSYCYCNKLVACGVFNFDCNQLCLYDLTKQRLKQSFKGHKGRINCIEFEIHNFEASTQIVSGSNDKRVLVYDQREETPVIALNGHSSSVLSVQVEGWKVVSGSDDGQVILWDLRKGWELWHIQERHPVSLCCFDDNYLITSHTPKDKIGYSPVDGSSLYTKHRGLIRVYDFLSDPTIKLPSICSSSYSEPAASYHHLDLRLPYDKLDT